MRTLLVAVILSLFLFIGCENSSDLVSPQIDNLPALKLSKVDSSVSATILASVSTTPVATNTDNGKSPNGNDINGNNGNHYAYAYGHNKKGEVASTTSPHSIVPEGLVAYYPFNSNAVDETGNGHDGTPYNAPLTTDRFGTANTAYAFNGLNSYVQVPHSEDFNIVGDITISVWYKSLGDFGNGYQTFIAKRDDSVGDPYMPWNFCISYYGQTTINEYKKLLFVDRTMYGTGGTYMFSNANITEGVWQHALITVQNGIATLYLNGVADRTMFFNPAFRTPNLYNVYIGWNKRPGYEQFYGSLDDIRIYNRALTQAEVLLLFNEPK